MQIKPIKILLISVTLSILGGAVAYAGTYNTNTSKAITASVKDTSGKTSEQYYLTVNKDAGVNTATASQWVNKGDSVNITATAKAGYKITSGTGSTGAINSAKTVVVTSKALGAIVTITYSYFISQVTINGTKVNSGWSGVIKQGDVIVASASNANYEWYYVDNNGVLGTGTAAICTAPTSSGTGTLAFGYGSRDYSYGIDRGGACADWVFT